MKFPHWCAALAAVCIFPAHAADIVLGADQARSLGIRTQALAAATGSVAALRLPGRIVLPPEQLRVVAAPANGVVSEVKVAVNEPVKPGQVLARLLSPELAMAQKDLLQAASQSRLARESYARDRQLLDEGIIAASRYQAARANLAQAEAALAQQRQTLRIMGVPPATIAAMAAGKTAGGGLSLVAPMAAVVLEARVTPGQRVDAAAPMFLLGRLDPLWVDMDVPVAQAAGIRVGTAVHAGETGGRVVSVGRMAGPGQSVTVRARLDGSPRNLAVGQAVEVQLQLAAPGWALPAAALIRSQGKDYVFVAVPAGFRAVAVSVAARTPHTVWVQGPLVAGQAVAVSGASQVKAIWTGVGAEGGE